MPGVDFFSLSFYNQENNRIFLKKGGWKVSKYECTVCGYIYDPAEGDPDSGIAPGTPFAALPDDWVCPMCGVGKDQFEELK